MRFAHAQSGARSSPVYPPHGCNIKERGGKKQWERSTISSFIALFICVILPPCEERRCCFSSLLFLVASILSLLFLPLAPLFSMLEKIMKQIKLQLFMKKKHHAHEGKFVMSIRTWQTWQRTHFIFIFSFIFFPTGSLEVHNVLDQPVMASLRAARAVALLWKPALVAPHHWRLGTARIRLHQLGAESNREVRLRSPRWRSHTCTYIDACTHPWVC